MVKGQQLFKNSPNLLETQTWSVTLYNKPSYPLNSIALCMTGKVWKTVFGMMNIFYKNEKGNNSYTNSSNVLKLELGSVTLYIKALYQFWIQ